MQHSCKRRKCLAWPRAGRGHTGDCAINKATHFNVQSDHDKVLQGPEASRQTNVHESLYIFVPVTSPLVDINDLTIGRLNDNNNQGHQSLSIYLAVHPHLHPRWRVAFTLLQPSDAHADSSSKTASMGA